MTWLNSVVQWWHWIVLGIVLISAELIVPNFIIIWFGLSALVVGIADTLFSLSISTQLYMWAIFSVIFLFLWFKYFKKSWRSEVGQSRGEDLHIPGIITAKIDNKRYRAEFDLPVLGDRKWIVESKDLLNIGDEIEVDRVYGQIIKVKKRRRSPK